jgi:hypothetical protein
MLRCGNIEVEQKRTHCPTDLTTSAITCCDTPSTCVSTEAVEPACLWAADLLLCQTGLRARRCAAQAVSFTLRELRPVVASVAQVFSKLRGGTTRMEQGIGQARSEVIDENRLRYSAGPIFAAAKTLSPIILRRLGPVRRAQARRS